MKLDIITNKNDEFYTPSYAIKPLLKYLREGSSVLCPFDTYESNFVKDLNSSGFRVNYSHIHSGQDFFDLDFVEEDYIVSNPPYSLKGQVFEKLFQLGKPFAMLVGVVGLFESKKRFSMFKENDFEIMYLSKRVSYFKSYEDQKPSLNPPFSSVYLCKDVLPKAIVFEEIYK